MAIFNGLLTVYSGLSIIVLWILLTTSRRPSLLIPSTIINCPGNKLTVSVHLVKSSWTRCPPPAPFAHSSTAVLQVSLASLVSHTIRPTANTGSVDMIVGLPMTVFGLHKRQYSSNRRLNQIDASFSRQFMCRLILATHSAGTITGLRSVCLMGAKWPLKAVSLISTNSLNAALTVVFGSFSAFGALFMVYAGPTPVTDRVANFSPHPGRPLSSLAHHSTHTVTPTTTNHLKCPPLTK